MTAVLSIPRFRKVVEYHGREWTYLELDPAGAGALVEIAETARLVADNLRSDHPDIHQSSYLLERALALVRFDR